MSHTALGLLRLPFTFHPLPFHTVRNSIVGRRPYCTPPFVRNQKDVSSHWPTPLSRLGNRIQHRGLKVSALSLTSKKRHGHKITMITAYDFPSAIHVARAEMDIILVGDSVAMVELGHSTTQPITVSDMLGHCAAVQRGVAFANVKDPPLLVGDMPFGSYEFENTDIALQNAYLFVKEAGMDAVKLEVMQSTTC